jgi:hypothetical protein
MDLCELEERAARTLDAATLSVYADALLERGDVRGEIIALELAIARDGAIDEHVRRRDALMHQWIGERRPSGRVVGGFLEIDASGLDAIDEVKRWMESDAAPFVRAIKLAGGLGEIAAALELVAARVRPLLCCLGLQTTPYVPRDIFQPRPAPSPIGVIGDPLLGALVESTPRLASVEVTGSSIFDSFRHPHVTHLSVTGFQGAKLGDLPGLASLDLAIHLATGTAATPPLSLMTLRLLDARAVPNLTHLDLSRNGPGLRAPFHLGGVVNIVKFASQLSVLPQLRSLRLPQFRSHDDANHLQMLLHRMPHLEMLELVRLPDDQRPVVARLTHPTARIVAS